MTFADPPRENHAGDSITLTTIHTTYYTGVTIQLKLRDKLIILLVASYGCIHFPKGTGNFFLNSQTFISILFSMISYVKIIRPSLIEQQIIILSLNRHF